MNEYGLNSKSVREVLERDWCGIDGDLLPVCITQPAHALGIVGQIKFCSLDAVLVIQPRLGVGEAALARAIDGIKIMIS